MDPSILVATLGEVELPVEKQPEGSISHLLSENKEI